MGEDNLQFQKQLWELRMKDSTELHSSSDISRSSDCEAVVNKNNLAPGLVSFEDGETSDTSRLLEKGISAPVKPGKTLGKTRTKRRRIIQNQSDLQEDGVEEAGPKTSGARRSVNEMETTERFFEFLFDDLKTATENLFRWMREEMQKVLDDHIGLSTPRRRCGNGEKVAVKRKRKPNVCVKGQPGNLKEKKPQSSEFQSSDNYLVEVKSDKGKKVPFSDLSQSPTSPTSADPNLQLQKTIVLAIEAQNSNSTKKPTIGNGMVDKRVLEISPNDSFNDKKASFFLERPNQMIDLNSFRGYYPMLQPENRSLGCFATQQNSRNVLPNFHQMSTSSSSMAGFLVPNHPGLDVGNSLVNPASIMGKNGNTMGLSMNEGAIQFSAGGNYSLLEHFLVNHQHGNGHSGYNPQVPDSRLLSYQMPKIREGPHFTK